MFHITRRRLLKNAGASALASTALFPAPADAAAEETRNRIIVAGGHPDDPESGCGGTMARFARAGHSVTALYLTRGEAGIKRKTHDQAAEIRSAEAAKACSVLKATPLFAGQIDGASEVDPARADEFTKLIASVDPHVVFTQWPVDSHADHRACASLTIAAWLAMKRKFALYFYEVSLGEQTQCFRPTSYVDVTDVEPIKREACMAHASQNPRGFYETDHVPMMKFRGLECGKKLAEAFVHHDGSPRSELPTP